MNTPETFMLKKHLPQTDAVDAAGRVVFRLKSFGYDAVFAGGCVRDFMLGRVPSDIDVATSATPDQIEAVFPKTLSIGKAFGVVIVIDGDIQTEVATFRGEGGYYDGRHPTEIEFRTAEEDSKRRDFTVNGMFFDPNEGMVIDYVGGLNDLRTGTIRAIGNPMERFEEDHLRMLRAVRFSATLDFKIDSETASAVRVLAPLVRKVSAERIGMELVRTFSEAIHPGDALQTLDNLGLLIETLPEVAKMKGVEQPPQFHPEGDVFVHTRLMLDSMEPAPRDPRLAMSVLLHDVGKPATFAIRIMKDGSPRISFQCHADVGAKMADMILRRLKFSGDFIKDVCNIIAHHMSFPELEKMRVSTQKKFFSSPTIDLELEVLRLDLLHSIGDLTLYETARAKLEEFRSNPEPILPPRWIKGGDVMAAGVREGREVGVILEAAYNRQLEGIDTGRDAQLEWLRGIVAQRR